MGGLPKRYVYIAIIAALLLWRSSARAEGYKAGGRGWVQFSGNNIRDATAEYIPDGNLSKCKIKCKADDNCVGFTIQKRKNKFKGGDTKCWLLQKTNDDIMVNGYVNMTRLVDDKTKTLWLKKEYSHTAAKAARAATNNAAANIPAPSNNEGAAGPAPVVNVTGLKVQLWEGINFEGASKGRFGITNGPINVPRGISSIEIPAGLKVTASFTQPGCRDYFEGTNICAGTYPKSTIEYTADVTNVGTEWNDNISEITVTAA